MKKFLPLIFVGIVGALGVSAMMPISASADWAKSEAQKVKTVCATEKVKEACYESTIAQLVPEYPVEEIFEVVRALRRLDSEYQFCHPLAHKVAQRLVAQDPEQWFNLVPLNPTDGICSNGFIHGIIIGKYRNVVLDDAGLADAMDGFQRACEPRENWSPTQLDSGMCYHGMGHLYAFITNADLAKSVELCKKTTKKPSGDYEQVCTEGVYMQMFQPLEPDDFELLEHLPYRVTAENYREFCGSYGSATSKGACLREAWMLFRPSILDGSHIEAFCARQPNEDETQKCKTTVYTILGRMHAGHLDRAKNACGKVKNDDDRAYCFALVAQTIIEEDRNQGSQAIAFCKSSPFTSDCINHLAERARFVFGKTGQFVTFCESLKNEYVTCPQ